MYLAISCFIKNVLLPDVLPTLTWSKSKFKIIPYFCATPRYFLIFLILLFTVLFLLPILYRCPL